MKQCLLIAAAIVTAAGMLIQLPEPRCEAGPPCHATRHDVHAAWWAVRRPWHGAYYHTSTGLPVSLVVPPTAHMQTQWGWGVGSTQSIPIYHQYGRSFDPGYGAGGVLAPFLPTPVHPSHTDQFGIYYNRAPY